MPTNADPCRPMKRGRSDSEHAVTALVSQAVVTGASTALADIPREGPGSLPCDAPRDAAGRELFIDNLLVRIHSIVEMIFVDRPCAMEFESPFPGSLISTLRRCKPDF